MDPLTAVGIGAGAVGAVVAAPVVLGAAGFTSAGIAAGSLVAAMQSAGAAGISSVAYGAVAAVGGTVGGVLASIF